MGEPPRGEPRRWPLASFSEATCSLEGSRAPRRAETGPSARGGHSLHGGRGVRVPFDGQRRAGGMGEPPGVSRDVGHWHVLPRQHARSRGRAETGRDGAECAGRGTRCMGGRACPHGGHGTRPGCSVYGALSFGIFFSSRRRHTRYWRDWSSDVCSSDLATTLATSTFFRGNMLARGLKGSSEIGRASCRERV